MAASLDSQQCPHCPKLPEGRINAVWLSWARFSVTRTATRGGDDFRKGNGSVAAVGFFSRAGASGSLRMEAKCLGSDQADDGTSSVIKSLVQPFAFG